MRIVFVAYHGSVHTRRWASFFADRGHEVHVVTCGGKMPAAYVVHDLGPLRWGKLGYLLRLPAARRVVRALRPDVVHAHYATSYGLLAFASGVRPLVVTAHGDDVLIAPRNPALRAVVRRVVRAAELVTVPSEQMREAVAALGAPAARTVVFQYGVDTARLARVADEARSAPEAQAGPMRVVSARPLLALYRIDGLVRAVALLRRRGLDVVCDVFGDGPERRPLEELAAELGVGELVRFHGHVDADDAELGIARADVFVSVAESDGASLALLEAMALGTLPVVSDIPGNRAWIADGVNGVLVDGEPSSIADGIERAAALDAAAARRENRRIVAERADRKNNLEALERRLDGLVGTVS